MKIVFDGRWLYRTGIGRYCEELLAQLQRLDHDNDYRVLLLPHQLERWRPSAPNFTAVATDVEVYTVQEQTKLPRQLLALKPDLVHFTSFNLPVPYPGAFVMTVHDLTLLRFKNVRGQGARRLAYEMKYQMMRQVLASGIGRARHILTPTEFVKAGLTELYPQATAKTTATLLACGETFATPGNITRFGLEPGFLLYVGNYYPYKNTAALVESYAASKARSAGHKLVLNGKADYFQDQLRELAGRLGVNHDIVWTGFTTDQELAALYRDAGLFVFPSLSEGFGLPGLEAMAHGTPVLAANATCLPEVYGDAAAYFDPYKAGDLTAQLDALTSDPQRLDRLRQRGHERVRQFDWERTARQTLSVYEAALNRPAGR